MSRHLMWRPKCVLLDSTPDFVIMGMEVQMYCSACKKKISTLSYTLKGHLCWKCIRPSSWALRLYGLLVIPVIIFVLWLVDSEPGLGETPDSVMMALVVVVLFGAVFRVGRRYLISSFYSSTDSTPGIGGGSEHLHSGTDGDASLA